MKVKRALEGVQIPPDRGRKLPRRDHTRRLQIGIMPGPYPHKRGSVGVVSRSGTLTYEAVKQTLITGSGPNLRLSVSAADPIKGNRAYRTCWNVPGRPRNPVDHHDRPRSAALAKKKRLSSFKDEKKRGRWEPTAGFIAGRYSPTKATAWAWPCHRGQVARATRKARSRR